MFLNRQINKATSSGGGGVCQMEVVLVWQHIGLPSLAWRSPWDQGLAVHTDGFSEAQGSVCFVSSVLSYSPSILPSLPISLLTPVC